MLAHVVMRIRCVLCGYKKNSNSVSIDVVYSVMYKTGKFSMRKFSVCDASHNATKNSSSVGIDVACGYTQYRIVSHVQF